MKKEKEIEAGVIVPAYDINEKAIEEYDALASHLEDLEDYYDAVKALREFQKSGEKAISADEVFGKIGL